MIGWKLLKAFIKVLCKNHETCSENVDGKRKRYFMKDSENKDEKTISNEKKAISGGIEMQESFIQTTTKKKQRKTIEANF